MSGLFEAIALDDSQQVVANRKATALAAKRVNERFARYMANSESREDAFTRWSFVEDDVRGVIAKAVEEAGGDAEHIEAAIKRSFLDSVFHGIGDALHGIGNAVSPMMSPMMAGMGMLPGIGAANQIVNQMAPGASLPGQPSGAGGSFIGSVHESRKPKLCPYHKEVVDASIASGDPQAGFNAMAQHAWGPMHCDGEYEGSCSFRREMTTQKWWDERDERLQERREERERERAEEEARQQAEQQAQEAEEAAEDAQEPAEALESTDPVPEAVEESEGFSEAPSASEVVDQEAPLAVAASFHQHAPLAAYDRYFNGVPGSAARTKVACIREHGSERGAQVFQTILAGRMEKLAPGKQHVPGATPKENRQYEHIKQQYLEKGMSEEEAKEIAARTVNKQKKSDATKTIDVEQGSGPSPKMDKRKWTEDNLTQRVRSEGENSRWPTHDDDLLKTERPENNDIRHEQPYEQIGENTTERVDVLKETPPSRSDATRHTWPSGETTAVSSAKDVDKNPLIEYLESEHEPQFVSHTAVQRALASK